MKKLPIYELVIGGDQDGFEMVSLVRDPAVERNFIAMNSEKNVSRFSVENEEKRIATGVIMLADTPIYRFDKKHGEHYVMFTKDALRQFVYKFFRDGRTSMVNTNHQHFAESVFLIESYFKDSERGLSPVEFSDVPEGSWMGTYRIENSEVWEKIKKDDFQGFSPEGYFTYKDGDQYKEINEFLNQLANG